MAIKQKIRVDRKGKTKEVSLTPIKAIRFFCVECMGYQVLEISKCTAPLCPLFSFRMGDAHTGRKGTSKIFSKLPFQKAIAGQISGDNIPARGNIVG